jgi:alpha-tubulin suppressor-like RCC1 family protein
MLAALLAFFTIGGCSSSKPVDSGYAVTGTLSGYTGAGLVLAATGLPDLAVPFNAKSFSFSGLLPNGPSHTVTVAKQPTVGGIRCSILGGASKASGADENVVVTCAPERTIASGNDHNLALNANGSLLAWGAGSDGQLGDGSKGTKLAPEPIGNVFTWAFVSAGQGHSTALRTDGSLWAWGSNGDGQFGNGTTTGSSSPTSIGDEQDWAFVSAGSDHTLAVKTDGSLWAWGANGVGQLGNGTIQYSSTRIQIGKEYNWAFVSAGHRFSTALKKDGSLWAWGINLYGQVGDGTALSTVLAPVKIDGDHAWTLVSAGESHVAALQADGSLWTWGNNSSCIAPGFLDTRLRYAATRNVNCSRALDGLTKPIFSTSHSAL